MNNLTAKELDTLEKIRSKEELQPFFFRKAKSLKWFDKLMQEGYFRPELNPKPKQSGKDDYVSIPFWPVTEYLSAASSELLSEKNEAYAEKVMEVIRTVTKYAIEHEFSNYHTWFQFSMIVQKIPSKLITNGDFLLFDYWLSDPYERDLVGREIGVKWIADLLDRDDTRSKELVCKLFRLVYKPEFHKRESILEGRKKAVLRFNIRWVDSKKMKSIPSKAGRVLGEQAVSIFHDQLESILIEVGNDKFSSVWRPAIDDHEQNYSKDSAENIILEAYRDSLLAFIDTDVDLAHEYIDKMLNSSFETERRIAIFVIDQKYSNLVGLVDHIIDGKYFTDNYRHEIWNFLANHYNVFESEKQKLVVKIIDSLKDPDEGEIQSKGRIAYIKAIWLSAIKNYDGAAQLYTKYIDDAGGEPEHPSFSRYIACYSVDHKSPFSKEELLSLSVSELYKQLDQYKENYKPSFDRNKPGLEGLLKIFKQVVKADPLRFYNHLNVFVKSDLAFVYILIESYHELWSEKIKLPWNEIWILLLDFCRDIVSQEQFWSLENTKQRTSFIANRYWVVSSIGRLIAAGARSDEHAFNEKLLSKAEEIISIPLEKEKGSEFTEDSNAVMVAINSPRGICLEALINITLRCCRLSDKQYRNHEKVWTHFQPFYEKEFRRSDINEYEFATLIANYLPNFLYMSKEWVLGKLHKIFDKTNYLTWLCAMNGYAHTGTVYEDIYNYLKNKGDLIQALDDEKIKGELKDNLIQKIIVAYINNFEKFEETESLIYILFKRKKHNELAQLIWFIWTLRRDADKNICTKVFELWPNFLKILDVNKKEDRLLASKLCDWSVFIDHVDNDNRHLILEVAPYVEEAFSTHNLLRSIARISSKQPHEAYEIWCRYLIGSHSDFPEESVREALTNILLSGPEGLHCADIIVDKYIRRGNERPACWLSEIKKTHSV